MAKIAYFILIIFKYSNLNMIKDYQMNFSILKLYKKDV